MTVFARRFGIHLSLCVGLVLRTTGYVTAGFASHVWQLLLSQGTIGPLCAELVELEHLQSLLSLSWITASLPNACKSKPA